MKSLLSTIALSLLLTTTAGAATTATMSLTGTVPLVMEVTMSNPTVTGLNVGVGGGEVVGDLGYVSNSSTGFTVTLSSLNGGYMLHTNGVDKIAYTLGTVADGTLLGVGAGVITSNTAEPVTVTGKTLTYTSATTMSGGGTQLVAGTYTDTVTATITAN